MSAAAPTILLAGCGKMGSALLVGWKTAFPKAQITIIDPNTVVAAAGHTQFKSPDELPQDFTADICVIAVKPQIMDGVANGLRKKLAASVPVLSIAAGKTLSYFAEYFGKERAIIRSMPNTPAAIAQGMTVACANSNVTDAHKALAAKLLQAVGKVEWITDEAMMDAVTAVSGSGPAYVFLLIEELAQAGMAAGLSGGLAMTLARQTVIGSAHLAEHHATIYAETLRKNVTSPGGTTEAALKVLMADDGLRPLLIKAVAAATQRGKDLAEN